MQWTAKWIWHSADALPNKNVYLYFRRRFRVTDPQADSERLVHCTAATQYQLFCNGRFVGRGPSPCDPHWQYYDTYDLRENLGPGENVIGLICHHFGEIGSLVQQTSGRGGLLVQSEIRDERGRPISSDASWRTSRAGAWDAEAPRFNAWVGFKELFDMRAVPEGWCEAGFADRGWQRAEIVGEWNTSPWENLIPREIPPLEEHPVPFAGVRAASPNLGRIGDADRFASHRGPLKVDASEPESLPTVVFDFEQEVVGYPELVIDAPGGGRVVLCYGESIRLYRGDCLLLKPGANRWSAFNRRAFRYLGLEISATPEPVLIRELRMNAVSYPCPERGTFGSSSEQLDRIWRTGVLTTRLGSQDHFEDSVLRERALWVGDARTMALLHYYVFGDSRLPAKCLRQMARVQHADGWIPAVGPQRSSWLLPDFCCHWVLMLHEYLLHTGELDLPRDLFEPLTRLLEWFDRQAEPDHLLSNDANSEWWCAIDWAEFDKRGKCGALQVLYVLALEAGAQIAALLGENGETWERRADAVRSAFREQFWGPARNVFIDSVGGRGEQSESVSVHTNALAVLAGMADGRDTEKRWRFLLDRHNAVQSNTPFFTGFVVEALFLQGLPDLALELISTYWGGMLERGARTWWELFDPASPRCETPYRFEDCERTSRCHGWGSAPTYLLQKYLLGVAPLESGFRTFTVTPALCSIREARGVVPTPQGDIRVEWRRGEDFRIRITVEGRMTGRIFLPFARSRRTTEIRGPGEIEIRGEL